MFSPFSCATFHHQEVDEDDDQPMISPPRKSSRSRSTGFHRRHSRDTKNPYSSRGLDKFSALVADLEEKRQKIYAQPDSKDISFVRFVYKDSTDTSLPVPIVVKLRDKKEDKAKTLTDHEEKHATPNIDPSSLAVKEVKPPPKLEPEKQSEQRTLWRWNMKSDKWRRPAYYLPLVIIFILVLLALFGRSFAILCTSVCWYAIPMLKESSNNATTGAKKKDYVRRLSDKNTAVTQELMSSPKSNHRFLGKHVHQKSL
ncbi:hypothetical protein PRUPE_2G244200 [Prunus persica]|uniref:ZCF37 n=1 Tax=Prunus persica TaxID=3760 RepID=M5X676_PRUPE|nr:uncharacterized protein LOC18785364 [Prunus persica]ONI24501.1 hypothetical protein PRUPE_2G244200 [Prunus persica]